MRSLFAALILLVVVPMPLVSQPSPDPASKEDVRQVLELTDARNQMQSVWTALAANKAKAEAAEYKRKNPQASPSELENVEIATRQSYEAGMTPALIEEMIDVIIPIYQRHFTHSDLLALSDFYASPVGQKLLKNTPALMMEGMQAGRAIMQKHMAECEAMVEKASHQAGQADMIDATADLEQPPK